MLKENDIIQKVLLTIEQYKGNANIFKNSVLNNEYTSKKSNFTRLLVWKTCFITESLNLQAWETNLKTSRVIYHKLRQSQEMQLPWWKLDIDSPFYAPEIVDRITKLSKPQRLVRVQNVQNDPLALKSRSPTPLGPYEISEEDVDLLQSIILDIHRLFPGEKLFHDETDAALQTKKQLVSILYIWSKCNPQVGYKQGIHEILGLLYLNLLAESVEIPNTNTFSSDDLRILSLYDVHYLLHDLFTILNRFLISSGVISQFYQTETHLMASIEHFNGMLMKTDQLIHYNLITKLRLESQLWIIRYLRLLLLRELGSNLEIPSLLWDKLAACQLLAGNGQQCIPDLIMFIIAVLLVHIKTELVLCDFSEALSLLLHFPITSRLNQDPEFVDKVFKDALHLYENKDNDLKLYEYGLKLNKKYNSRLRVSVGYTSGDSPSNSLSAVSSPKLSTEVTRSIPTAEDSRAAKMAFEKVRMEMRLKKKAQLMLRN
ncbi:CIC11C00000000757 [Sungouiella intermedia]|uniref:CIC11C00000000757 n=1 Tax=Sungouiella intermedia TaxID=45354 RepID=A0A1L0C1A5_9ASCO|nr:CIC11C00000000757 [[Candida] intermedia]